MKRGYIQSQTIEKRIIRIIFKSIQKDVKKSWNGIESIVTLKFKDKTTPNSLMVNGNVIANKNCIAKILNDFSVNVGSNLASRIPKGKRPLKYI